MLGWALIGAGLALALPGFVVGLVLAEERSTEFPWSTHDSLSVTRRQCWGVVIVGLVMLAIGYAGL